MEKHAEGMSMCVPIPGRDYFGSSGYLSDVRRTRRGTP